jgi:sterol desaturase/sphingolipid hydroxylase (fatty acid hydroxylase superfamily)
MTISDDFPVRYSEMGGLPVDYTGDPPIRLFKSDFLEFFTHITPVVIVIIWLPVIAWLLARAVIANPGAGLPAYLPLGVLLGMFLWTLAEYILHRFLFHFHPRGVLLKRVVFLFHGIHHAQPGCRTRLVMPPAVSIPMAFVFYGLFYAVVGLLLGAPAWVDPLVGGLLLGYLIYDLTHYAVHYLPMRWGFLRYLKRHHMLHHYKTPDSRFGVSSPLWDIVFGTLPAGDETPDKQMAVR